MWAQLRLAVLLCQLLSACGHNGYTLHVTAPGSMAGTKVPLLDPSNVEVARLNDGFTVGVWLLFENVNPSQMQPTVMINTHLEINFFEPFAGLHGGFQFGTSAPASVSTLPDKGTAWHHYAQSWDRLAGTTALYIDGQLISTGTGSTSPTWLSADQAYLHLGMHCYPEAYLSSAYTACNTDFQLSGRMDDVAVWAGALSAAEIAARFDQSLAARRRAGLEPDLILLYDFEGVGYEAAHGVQTVPNHGSAGADYDLMLGRLAKPAGGELFGLSYVDGSSVQRPFIPPVVVPSSESTAWPTPRAQDPAAPIVVTCAAGETVAISQHGVSTSYTAPSPFAATATFSSGGTSIEVVPLMPPTAHTLSATGLEDGAVPIRLFATYASGLPVEVVLMTPPAKGTLHEIAHCDSTALLTPLAAPGAVADATGLCVLYRPDQDAHGAPHDSFSYAVRYVARPTLVSNTATVTLNVKSFDDLPSTASQSVVMVEDGGPVLISLAAADPDAGTPLDMYIATLPTRGKLYLTSDGTLAGERTLIDRPYSFFDVGSDVQAQYLDQVVAVSSFWGLPPDASYHPLTVLGPPDCSTQGECKTEDLRPGLNWLSDATVYPPIGQRVLHAGLVAFVAAVNATASTVDLHYHRMYKPDAAAGGALRQCQFDPAQPALRTYPDHCDFALAPAGGGVLARTAPRAELSGMAAGAWSPLRKAYMGNLTSAGGGAFGPQYVFAHNQAEHYPLNTPPYTEYIEVSLAQSTYLVSLELGSPRGMGHVVNLKAWQDSAQAWVSFYQGAPRVEEAAAYMETKRYWRWAPDVCRLHFPVQRLRIEVDTSLETGVSDWNYIDYVLVHGEMSAIQPAALRTGVPYVVYVPDQDEEGDDEFTYVATDCPGSMLRSSTADGAATGTVTIRINATNDAPVATPQTLQLPVDTSQTLLVLAAADVDSTALTYTITSLPPDVRVRGGDDSGGSGGGADVSEGAALSSPFLTLSSSTCGASPLAFTVSDGELTSAPATTTVEVVCPRACSEADMEVRVSACDDGAQRLASWNWTAGTTCDLPRAKPLLEDVTIQCDHIAWGSPSAVAVIAVAALLIACKLGLLLYFLRYRHTPAFKQSQSTFGVLCIVGGIAADLTPLQLLGETSTSRCMRFPTWLLVSVTMLYGPLVLKTWKVWKVFDNPSLKELRLSNSRLIGYLALVILLEVGLAVVFGAAMPLEALEYNYTFSAGNGVLPRTRCSEDNTIFHLVAYAIVAVPLCAGLFLAFKTRRVHGDYTDNKSTLLSLYTLVLAALVLIPVTRILGDNTRATFLMVSIGVLFVSTVSVLLFTLPKVLYHRGCLLSPAQVATNQPTSMHASSVLGGGSAMGSDLAADELAELRAELSEMREANMELRAQLKQLQSEGAAPPASYAGAAPAPAADGMHARVPQPPVEPPPELGGVTLGSSQGSGIDEAVSILQAAPRDK